MRRYPPWATVPNPVKTGWILGAGFCRSLGGPLLNDFFSYQSLRRIQAHYSTAHYSGLSTAEDIVDLYRAGLTSERGPEWSNAEDFACRIDLCSRSEAERAALTHAVKDLFEAPSRPRLLAQLKTDHGSRRLHAAVLKLLAAECCLFLRELQHKLELLRPYERWGEALTAEDTVITFNYDRTPDIVRMRARSTHPILVPTPSESAALSSSRQPIVLKLHGSVDWVCVDGSLVRANTCPDLQDRAIHAALLCETSDKLGIATPGPTKLEMVNKSLRELWTYAQGAITRADQIVIVGYSFPPSDSYSRDTVLGWIAENIKQRPSRRPLFIDIVLGDDLDSPASRRLKGLMTALGAQVRQHAMRAEDFIAHYRTILRPDHDGV